MVQGCPGKHKVLYVNDIRQSLVEMHRLLCEHSHYEHDHDKCHVCTVNERGRPKIRRDIQEMLYQGMIEILQNRNEDEVHVITPVEPWNHKAGAVTSTLHQKLKFVKNKKLVVIGEEKALLVIHLSSFSYINAKDEVGTPFQALSIVEPSRKGLSSFVSYNDAKLAIEHGATNGLGKMIKMEDNKAWAGMGYSSGVPNDLRLFQSGGFIHTIGDQEATAIIKEDEEEDLGNFVIPGGSCNNWVVVDVPTVIHESTLTKPIEHNDPTPSPNFKFPVFETEEDDVEEIPDEITRLLEHQEKIIQPHLENLETVNLGSKDCIHEVKIGELLEESVKKGLIELLQEYVNVFAWSYEDMPGLDTDIVQHFLPLKPECVPVKQKLRRTHPDMAVEIKEEVQKQIDAGFLVTSTYPQSVANIVPFT
ncbi:hypothetical protein KIW84_055242 [Lathyrus oleraceus]|uniref:Uncharacterized protein n=1 Tax=Pisum sativum TaxID=3888 RepID=A0A9D5AL43_PEA|nr:hypothetical protein KIW84_055242 [Pisum sativum]